MEVDGVHVALATAVTRVDNGDIKAGYPGFGPLLPVVSKATMKKSGGEERRVSSVAYGSWAWKKAVAKGVCALPVFSLVLIPTAFFGFPVVLPYLFVKFLRADHAGGKYRFLLSALLFVMYPLGPIIELFLVVALIVIVPIWVPVGALLFGTSQGVGLTVVGAAYTRGGVGLLLLPLVVIVSASLWFVIGLGLSLLLLAALVPLGLVLAPLWVPLCCMAWYLLIPSFYCELVNTEAIDAFKDKVVADVVGRVRSLRRLYEAVITELW
jgi:hypothetical protein